MNRLRVLPLLALVAVAVAACDRQDRRAGDPVIANAQMSNPLLDPAKEMARRWGTVFTDATIRTQAAKDLGYTLGALAPDEAAFRATSPEQIVTVERSPIRTRSTMTASGASATMVDRYTFTFAGSGDDGRDTKPASEVDKIPLRVLMGFLQRFDVQPDDAIKVAIKQLGPVHKALPGATIDFAPEPPADPRRKRNRRSVLTITRPGAIESPALTTSAAQKIPARK